MLSYAASESKTVTVIIIDGGIGPVTAMYICKGIDDAIESNSNALIIKLNTPGELLESTRNIASYLLDSEITVIVYVVRVELVPVQRGYLKKKLQIIHFFKKFLRRFSV